MVCDNEDGEMLILGLYVDNLIIAHSAKLTEDGTPVDAGSMYASSRPNSLRIGRSKTRGR